MGYVGKKPADIIATAVDTTTGTFSGDLTVDTNTLYVDSANNRVGINETVPFAKLHISDTQTGKTSAGSTGDLLVLEDDNNGMSIISSNSGQGHILFADVDDSAAGAIAYDHSSDKIRFRTNSSWDRVIIDSSGNLLVGKTTTAIADVGMVIGATGFGTFTRDGFEPLSLNRKTSDGDIAVFYKDGSPMGSIGTFGSALYISSPDGTDAGLRVGNSTVLPVTTTGSLRDNAIDLGSASARWKDLYLSGGVTTGTESNFVSATSTNIVAKSTNGNGGYLNYSGLTSGGTTTFSVTHNGNVYAADGINLGGTGSANKLDDYEEGTWTPQIFSNTTQISVNNVNGFYTVIGNQVFVYGGATRDDTASLTGNVSIKNLPFTSESSSRNLSLTGGVWFDKASATDIVGLSWVGNNAAQISVKSMNGTGGATYVSADNFENGRPVYFSATYRIA